jgi:hypothetical protein
MLFSALSPALAAAFLKDTPGALGRMLGIASPPALSEVEECPEHAAHHGAPAGDRSDDGNPEHAGHGVFCSFCLNPGSLVAVLAPAAPIGLPDLAFDITAAPPPPVRIQAAAASYRARAPPAVL